MVPRVSSTVQTNILPALEDPIASLQSPQQCSTNLAYLQSGPDRHCTTKRKFEEVGYGCIAEETDAMEKTYAELQNVKTLRLDSDIDPSSLSDSASLEKSHNTSPSILETFLTSGGLSGALIGSNISHFPSLEPTSSVNGPSLVQQLSSADMSGLGGSSLDLQQLGKLYHQNTNLLACDRSMPSERLICPPATLYTQCYQANPIISSQATRDSGAAPVMLDPSLNAVCQGKRVHRLDSSDCHIPPQKPGHAHEHHYNGLGSSPAPVSTSVDASLHPLSQSVTHGMTPEQAKFIPGPSQHNIPVEQLPPCTKDPFISPINRVQNTVNSVHMTAKKCPGEIIISNSSLSGEVLVKTVMKPVVSLLTGLCDHSQKTVSCTEDVSTTVGETWSTSPSKAQVDGKDKPKHKTLSSKIKEITDRIRKDEETTKVHNIHHSEIKEFQKKMVDKKKKKEKIPKIHLSNPLSMDVTNEHVRTSEQYTGHVSTDPMVSGASNVHLTKTSESLEGKLCTEAAAHDDNSNLDKDGDLSKLKGIINNNTSYLI